MCMVSLTLAMRESRIIMVDFQWDLCGALLEASKGCVPPFCKVRRSCAHGRLHSNLAYLSSCKACALQRYICCDASCAPEGTETLLWLWLV